MRERVCKNCGGKQYEVVGQNMVKCQFCGTLYVDEYASKEEEVLSVGAYEKLRELDFDGAVDEFDKIISLYPLGFESYYGRCLAKNKIIFYNNKKGTSKKPKFFGDEIPSILQDEDFLKAVENAPDETAKTYNEQAKRIEKFSKAYHQLPDDFKFDVVALAVDFDKENPDQKILDLIAQLQQENISTYFIQNLEGKEKEEETFKALSTCKVLLVFANDKKGYNYGENKNVFDRYFHFIKLKKKAKSSFIIALDEDNVKLSDLPKDFASCKSVVDLNSSSFLQDAVVLIKKEMKKTIDVVAKIETIKLEKVEPIKKEVIQIESINPVELGNYHIENLELSETNKIKWIFLTLKNGDFGSASELIQTELLKDENNSELLFADLMCKNKIKTQEEFFSSLANFRDKEQIDKILHYASKDFAEVFVDSWEKLLMKLDSEEYYNAFLLYLAKFNTSNRDDFVKSAENKAIETLDEQLIEKVLQCFRPDEIERFINFYFMLAQKSDKQEYYQKILEIDAGHEQSNFALLLQHFKTKNDILTYKNKQEVEDIFKYLDENARGQIISAIVNLILPVSFLDLEKAEQQLDFYLGYVSNETQLVEILKKIAEKFKEMRFFKQAEKYLSIAISKTTKQAQLYWELIEIKSHCSSDSELIMSDIKISQLPEWETLLVTANEEEAEWYAEIVSKVNLYEGQKIPFKPDLMDKVTLLEKLRDFLNRNEKILLELEMQENENSYKAISYYKLQLIPFEQYIKLIETEEDFQKYCDLIEKIEKRLNLLDLTLETSINVTNIYDKEEGLKNLQNKEKQKEQIYNKAKKEISKSKFWKKFLFGFLICFPVVFLTMLAIIAIFMPKEVYMYFSQDFLIYSLFFTFTATFFCVLLPTKIKNTLTKGWKISSYIVAGLGIVYFILVLVLIYFSPTALSISNADELNVLLHNANYASFELDCDVDLKDITWDGVNFSGKFNGNGYKIYNLKFKPQAKIGLFRHNNGEIENLQIFLQEDIAYFNVEKAGFITVENNGTIKNCQVNGNVVFMSKQDLTIGGIASQMNSGEISNCSSFLNITISSNVENLTIGAIVGNVPASKKSIFIEKNNVQSNITITSTATENLEVGGLVGFLGNIEKSLISKNKTDIQISATGKISNYFVGGIVGQGFDSCENSYATGKIDFFDVQGVGYIGGLYGNFRNGNRQKNINHCYSIVEIDANEQAKLGALVGKLGGLVSYCFSNQEFQLYSEKESNFADAPYCGILLEKFYDEKFGFNEEIWNIYSDLYPTLK